MIPPITIDMVSSPHACLSIIRVKPLISQMPKSNAPIITTCINRLSNACLALLAVSLACMIATGSFGAQVAAHPITSKSI